MDAGTGDFELTADGDVTLNDAAVTTEGNVTISTTGSINGSNGTTADILADGDVSLTGNGIGAEAAFVIIDEDAQTNSGDSSLTVNNIGGEGTTDIDIDVVGDMFSAVSITLSKAGAYADVDFGSGDAIDIDGGVGVSTLNAVVTSNYEMSFTFEHTEASTGVTVTSVNTNGTVDSAVSITSAAGIALADGAIDAGTGTVALTATSGDITDADGNDAVSQITAGDLSLTAVAAETAIGATGVGAIDVTISGGLTATASDGTGGIFVSQTGGLALVAVNAATGDVELTSDGAISDAAAENTDVDVTGASVTLAASSGVGASNNILDTAADTLDGSTATGGFFIDETDAVTVNTVDAGSGDFDLTAGGAVTLNNSAITTTGNATVTATAGAVNASDGTTTDILADGNVSLTGAGVGDTFNVLIDDTSETGTGDASATLTISNASTNSANAVVGVARDLFSAASLTQADADSSADVSIADTNSGNGTFNATIDIDSISSTEAKVNSVVQGDIGFDFSFEMTDAGGDMSIEGGTLETGANNVTLTSAKDIKVGDGETAEIAIDASGGGNVTLDAAGAITDAGDIIAMGAGDLLLKAGTGIGASGVGNAIETTGLTDVAATSGDGGIFLNNSTSGDINITSVGGTDGLTATASGDISITNAAGSITTTNVVTASGAASAVALNASTSLDINAGATAGTGGVTLDASTGISLSDGAVTTTGNADLTAGGAISSDNDSGADILADGNVTLTGAGIGTDLATIIIDDHDETGSGNSTLSVSNTSSGGAEVDIDVVGDIFDTVSITQADADSSANISFVNGDVIDIDGGATGVTLTSIDTSNNAMAFSFDLTEGSTDVTLGTAVDTGGGDFSLTATGDINVNAAITATSAEVFLTAGDGVSQNALGGITAGSLGVTAGGAVDLDNATNTVSTFAFDAEGQQVNFTNTGDFSIGTVGGITSSVADSAIITANSALSIDHALGADTLLGLYADDGVNVNAAVTATGDLDIDADSNDDGTGSLTFGASGSISGEVIDITADDIDLSAASRQVIYSGDETTIIDSDGDGIGLGTDVTDGLNISAAELQKIYNGGSTLDLITSGDIEVGAISGANSDNANNVTLKAGGTVSFSASGATFDGLEVLADQGIDVLGDLSTDTNNMVLDGDANNANDAGDDRLEFAADITLDSSGSLTLAATTGSIFADPGDMTIRADNGITIADLFTPLGSDIDSVTFNADADADGTGTFTVSSGASINAFFSTELDVYVTADDIEIAGTTIRGVDLTITDSDGDGIGLGDTEVTDGLNISAAELEKIGFYSGDDLTLSTSGGVTVDNISATNSDGAATVTIGAEGPVGFTSNSSTFNALTVNSNDGIDILSNLYTDTGSLVLSGDANSVDDIGDDAIDIGAGLTLSSAGGITLDAASGGVVGAGALTLSAESGVTVNDDLSTLGTLTIDTDTENNGSGGLNVYDTELNSDGNAVNVTAADVVMDSSASINAGSATVTLLSSDGGAIALGGDNSSEFELSDEEIGSITSGLLVIGNSSGGNIALSGEVDSGNSGTIHLRTGGTVDDSTGNYSISVANLAISAGSGVTLDGNSNDVDTLAVELSSAGDIEFYDTDDLEIGSVEGASTVSGLTTVGSSITVDADDTITVNEAISAGGDGSVNVTATGAGSIDVNAAVSTSGGGIYLDASGGVTSNGSGAFDSDGGKIDIYAYDSISLSGALDSSGETSDGNVKIYSYYGSVTVDTDAAITTGGGNVDIDASDSITVNASITTSGGGKIEVYADGNISLDAAIDSSGNSTDGNVVIDSEYGSVTLEDGAVITTGGGSADIDASESITVNASITTSGGGIYLDSASDVSTSSLGSLTSGGGIIDIDGSTGVSLNAALNSSGSGGDVNVRSYGTTEIYAAITSGDGGVKIYGYDIVSDGTGIITTSGGEGEASGSVGIYGGEGVSGNGVNGAVNLLGDIVTSGNGENADGGSVLIETYDGNIDVDITTTSGGEGTSFGGSAGTVRIDAGNSIDDSGSVTVNGAITALGGVGAEGNGNGGSVYVDAITDITLDASIGSGGGQVNVGAGNDVTLNANGDITSAGGNVTVTADANSDENVDGGALTMSATTEISAGAGEIALYSDQTISLGSLLSDNTGSAAVSITSTSGGLTDVHSGPEVVAVAGQLTIRTATGVVTNGPEFVVDRVDWLNDGSGDLAIANLQSGTVLQAVNLGGGSVSISKAPFESYDGGSIIVDGNVSAEGAGTVTLTATESTGNADITLNAGEFSVSSEQGQVTLTGGEGSVTVNTAIATAGGAVDINAETGVTSGSGGTITTADNETAGGLSGNVDIDTSGTAADISLAGTIDSSGGDATGATTGGEGGIVSITTVDGAIELGIVNASGGDSTDGSGAGGNAAAVNLTAGDTGGSVTLNGLVSALGGDGSTNPTNGTNATVTLTAGANVTDTNGASLSITGGSLVIDAESGVSGNSPIETAVDDLDIDTNSGTIEILELYDDVTVINLTNTGSGGITLEAAGGEGGNITLGNYGSDTVSSDGGLVTIDASGSLTLNGGIQSNGGTVDLDADTGVTSDGNGTINTSGGEGEAGGAVYIDVNQAGDVSLAGTIDTSGSDATGASTGGEGGLVTIDTDDGSIDVADITTSGGDSSTGGSAGNVTLTTGTGDGSGNITLSGTITALLGGEGGSDGTVYLDAVGAVIDGNGTGLNVEAGLLDIDADTGIGSENDIETTVTTLYAVNSASGNIAINETDSIDVEHIDQNAGSGSVTINAGGDILVSAQTKGSISAESGSVTLSAGGYVYVDDTITTQGGDVFIDADGTYVVIDAAVTTNGGTVDIEAGSYVNVNAAIDTSGGADGHVYIDAYGGDVKIFDGASVTTGGGDVSANATNNIRTYAGITTAGGNVFLDAESGFYSSALGIIDTDGGNVDIEAETSVAQFGTITTTDDVAGADSGDVDIDVYGASGIISIGAEIVTSGAGGASSGAAGGGAGGNVDITTFDGAITIDADITTSGGAGDGDVGGAAGHIYVYANDGSGNGVGRDITVFPPIALTARGGAGTGAGYGDVNIDNDGHGGRVRLHADGNVTVYGDGNAATFEIDTRGGNAVTSGFGGLGAEGSIKAYNGEVTLGGDINTSGGAGAVNGDGGDAGDVIITADGSAGVALNATITAIGAAGGDGGDGGFVDLFTFNGGAITLADTKTIDTQGGNATDSAGGEGGDVDLYTYNGGAITVVGDITTTGGDGSGSGSAGGGGNIEIHAGFTSGAGAVDVSGILTADGGDGAEFGASTGGEGGGVHITTDDGEIDVYNINASGGTGGSSGTAGSADYVTIQARDAGNASGNITLNGTITALGGGDGGSNGAVSLYADGAVIDANDTVYDDIAAGDLLIRADVGIGAEGGVLETAVDTLGCP